MADPHHDVSRISPCHAAIGFLVEEGDHPKALTQPTEFATFFSITSADATGAKKHHQALFQREGISTHVSETNETTL